MANFITTDYLDYFQHRGFVPQKSPDDVLDAVPVTLRRLIRLKEVGRYSRMLASTQEMTATPGQYQSVELPPVTEDLIIGAGGIQIPIVYLVTSSPVGIGVNFGTWSARTESAAEAQLGIITSGLRALYPAIDYTSDNRWPDGLTHSGFALGIPSAKPHPTNLTCLDRIIRAMSGGTWAIMVLAQPVQEKDCISLRQQTLNEMRVVGSMQQAERAPSPLKNTYYTLLDGYLQELSHGLAVGSWRTGVYLLGDRESYFRLTSLWRGLFAGPRSEQQPLRIHDHAPVAEWAAAWALPDVAAVSGPGHFQHPFQLQTLLNSSQLATYIQLPVNETAGFKISTVPEFDAIPPKVSAGSGIDVGAVMQQSQVSKTPYSVSSKSLTRHMLIAGITGSGKTNTCFNLLTQLYERGIPFLVIEPTKREYRTLLNDSAIGENLQVFTLGDENIAPFRMNPFEVEPGVSVATHIDLLKSVFNAAFSMWTVLPQILEQSLHEVYQQYGWDVVHGENTRIGDAEYAPADAFPTLADLESCVIRVVDQLGYEPDTTSEFKAALVTRIRSLRIGGKGKMLDTRQSFPMQELMTKPIVIELEGIGDDDEKAFVIGILLARLYEHLRGKGPSADSALSHVCVIEEAHRLLANVQQSASHETANTRGKAVETFVNMLSEVRAYGEGFIVAEQIPEKLARDVIKNTNIKLVHRTVAGDDRKLLADAMNMRDQQSDALSTLRLGEVVVFSEGDDRPVMVKVGRHKFSDNASSASVLNRRVESRALAITDSADSDFRSLRSSPEWDRVRLLAESAEFQRLMSTLLLRLAVGGNSIESELEEAIDFAQSRKPGLMQSDAYLPSLILQGLELSLRSLARTYQWDFQSVSDLCDHLLPQVFNALELLDSASATLPNEGSATITHAIKFKAMYQDLCSRGFNPYPSCMQICDQSPPRCLFRHHVAKDAQSTDVWREITVAIGQSAEPTELVHKVSASLARIVSPLQLGDEYGSRAALCLATQVLTGMEEFPPGPRNNLLQNLITEFLE